MYGMIKTNGLPLDNSTPLDIDSENDEFVSDQIVQTIKIDFYNTNNCFDYMVLKHNDLQLIVEQ